MTLSIIITIVLGFATCVSPPIVALINNSHSRKLRKMELDAANATQKQDLEMQLKQQLLTFEYDRKYHAYNNFVVSASKYMYDYQNWETYSSLVSAYNDCFLNGFTFDAGNFMDYVKPPDSISKLTYDEISKMESYLVRNISYQFEMDLHKTLHRITSEKTDET